MFLWLATTEAQHVRTAAISTVAVISLQGFDVILTACEVKPVFCFRRRLQRAALLTVYQKKMIISFAYCDCFLFFVFLHATTKAFIWPQKKKKSMIIYSSVIVCVWVGAHTHTGERLHRRREGGHGIQARDVQAHCQAHAVLQPQLRYQQPRGKSVASHACAFFARGRDPRREQWSKNQKPI